MQTVYAAVHTLAASVALPDRKSSEAPSHEGMTAVLLILGLVSGALGLVVFCSLVMNEDVDET